MKRRGVVHVAVVAAIVLLVGIRAAGPSAGSGPPGGFPRKPVRVVVPFAAGGGSDTFARLLQRAVAEEDLLGQPLVIVNQAGGSGTIGSRSVRDAKPDGYTILCLHDAIMTAKLSGKVDYGIEAFAPIAQTGDIVLLVVVKGDSRFRSLRELMEAARESPGTVAFGTNIGSPAHFAGRTLEEAVPGARFNFVQSGGGANRYNLLVGGTIEVGVFSLEEFVRFRGDDTLRALATLSPERHEAIPEVPSAVEQGIEAVSGSAHYWWAPKGTPVDRVERLAAVLREAMESESVRNALQRLKIDPVFRTGADLDAHLAARTEELSTLRLTERRDLPDFPLLVMMAVGVLGALVVGESLRHRGRKATAGGPLGRGGLAWSCFAALALYALVLHLGVLPYVLATVLFVFVSGGMMAEWRPRSLLVVAELALLTGLGSDLIFTQVFSVALP